MVIQDIRTGRISLPLRHPFKTALRTVTHLEDVVVMVVADDGQVGYGEAPPTAVITGDTMGSVECAVRDFIRPRHGGDGGGGSGRGDEKAPGLHGKEHHCQGGGGHGDLRSLG